MDISVIIPTYKPGSYIWECLESINKQTFPKNKFEVIIGLNGCNEPYYSQIKNYVESNLKDLNIILLQSEDGGASVGRNMGLDNASGEYITFIDDDDFVSECYLEELYRNVTPHVISISYAKAFIDDEERTPVPYGIEKNFDYCKKHNCNKLETRARKFFNGPVMKLYHKNIIGNRRFDTSFKISQDCIFNFTISDRINEVAFTDNKAIYYRRVRPNSATTTKRSMRQKFSLSIKSILTYSKIYFSGNYSTYFYLTRVAVEVKYIIGIPFNK